VSDASSAGRRRGSIAVYGIAFVVMLAAGAALGLAARELLRETGLLWASIGLSAAAAVLAALSLALPGRS
jgi:hypothetical protein